LAQTAETIAAPAAADSASTRIGWLALGAILILAAVLRVHAISGASIWFDESISWYEASQDFPAMIALMARDVHPPLHSSILHFVILAFGDSEAALRWPSAILGVAAVAAIFWVGRLIDGPTTGILAAALLCLSGFHIHYSQEARPYALLALTATLFTGTLIRALQTDRRTWHGLSALAALFLLYSHAYGQLLWFSLALAAIAHALVRRDPEPKVLVRWAAGQAIAVLAFLPWAGILAWHYKQMALTGRAWLQRPDGAYMLDIIRSLGSGRLMTLALLAGAVLAFVPLPRWLAANGHRRAAQGAHGLDRWLLIAWLLGPLLLALITSLVSQPILMPRYLIGSLPAALILASEGFTRLSRLWGKWVVGLPIIGAAVNLYVYQPPRHEDARAMVKAYAEQAAPGDCVFLNQPGLEHEIRYYHRDLPPCFIGSYRAADIAPWTVAAPRAWMFFGYGDPDERRKIFESLSAHGWEARPVMSGYGLSLLLAEPVK
jgi:mannosyltransferase